ncbi:esterase family protein [Pelagicoccus sp. NFK12]|uniref:Esterase family protein n=1 Tax=Pelagicoccus enzymogenes TaxID=2773457 RepID=A0A927FCB3_9BACT|nr:alpha/beta hydrolase-fold protein [Pelagicoccus enzymogenes]MBD5782229.1 esterase family protein [Pelagicoccus enzymogenes]
MPETEYTLRSEILDNERRIWIREPASLQTDLDLLIVLDAELYRNRVQAPQIIEDLFESGTLAQTLVVYVSSVSMDVRWIECPCYPPFAAFVTKELIPSIHERYPKTVQAKERVIAGLSYTGLAASFVALTHDGLFTKVISQSGSYWSNDCWLIREFDGQSLNHPPAFFLDVGDKETQEYVWHKEDVVQTISQVEGVERFRDMLLKNGYEVRYDTFSGGHSAEAWATSLPNALKWALG